MNCLRNSKDTSVDGTQRRGCSGGTGQEVQGNQIIIIGRYMRCLSRAQALGRF